MGSAHQLNWSLVWKKLNFEIADKQKLRENDEISHNVIDF